MTDNPNYHVTQDGYERRPDAPNAKHKSRISWTRQADIEATRAWLKQQRELQRQRNEEYKRRHNG